jgi:3-deoxy-D-manno-octulosonic-acid transferase
VFVAGSTQEGEEAAALAAYRTARRRHSRLRLVLVPRHQERFEKVAAWLHEQGEATIRRSGKPPLPMTARRDAPPVILVDTVGELASVGSWRASGAWRMWPSWGEASCPVAVART